MNTRRARAGVEKKRHEGELATTYVRVVPSMSTLQKLDLVKVCNALDAEFGSCYFVSRRARRPGVTAVQHVFELTTMVRITFWHRHQRILEKSGYLLRAKYRKGYDPADGDLDENKATHPVASVFLLNRIVHLHLCFCRELQ